LNFETILTALITSLGISITAVVWLTKRLINHRIGKDLELFKVKLLKDAQSEKIAKELDAKKDAEKFTGELSTRREYEMEARKRLYMAIGPLKLQILLACRDLSGRVHTYGTRDRYNTNINEHYGRSFLFRILRPISICELIERQIAFADFSVDDQAMDLLRFKKCVYAAFSGSSLTEGHPKVDWKSQIEHIYYDRLNHAANELIVQEKDSAPRIMRFDEFERFAESKQAHKLLSPFPEILENFCPSDKPLFWLRLVGYGYLCNQLINKLGGNIGFERRCYDIETMLKVVSDETIVGDINTYCSRIRKMPESPL